MIFVLKLISFFRLFQFIRKYLSVRACIVWKSSQLNYKVDRLTDICMVRLFYRKEFPEPYPELARALGAEIFVKMVNGFRSLAIFASPKMF